VAIPKDGLDEQIVEEQNAQPDMMPELSPGADLPEAEPVQIAASGFLRKATDAIFQPGPARADVINKPTKPGEAPQVTVEEPLVRVDESGDIMVRRATAEEMAELGAFADAPDDGMEVLLPNLKKIRPNLSKIALSADGQTLDDPMTQAEQELAGLISATYTQYKDIVTQSGQRILRTGERGFKKVIEDANRIGSADIFLQLMQREPGDRPFTDSEILAARRTVLALQLEAQRLIKIAKDSGDIADQVRAAQAISLEGYASIQLVGIQEAIGRTLATQKIIAAPSKARVQSMRTMLETTQQTGGPSAIVDADNIDQFIEAYGGEDALALFIHYYDRLPADGSRHKFARRSIARRGADMMVEIYQSALLSNFLTHSFNMAGNVVHAEMLVLERALEGRPKEAFAMLAAQPKYFGQALRAGFHALKHERSMTDQTSRLDVDMRAVSRQGAGLRNRAEGGGAVESAAAHFFDGFGVMMRLQGFRPMIAMDEFSKSMARGMQIEALATRAQTDAFRAARQAGDAKDVAQEKASAAYLTTLHSESAFEQGSEFARMVTFQDDLPGALGQLSGFMSHPLVKIWVPFYKTPTQVMRRITERTPLAIAMPSVLRDKIIRGSAADRREAMSRIATGSALAATTMSLAKGMYSDDFTITGYGPTNAEQRRTWLENNRPYSIGIRKDNGTWEWIGYERYDPMSGLLAAWVDTADTLEYADSVEMADDLALNVGLATSRYVGTALPMTQFIGEMLDIAGSPFAPSESKIDRVRQLLAKQAATSGLVVGQQIGTVGLAPQSLMAQTERYLDPFARSTIPDSRYNYVPGVGLQPEIRGIYEALQYARSRTPGLSADLPIGRNRWYEPRFQGQVHNLEDGRLRGNIWHSFVPYRVQQLPQANIVNEELERLGLGFGMLPQSMNEPMLKLNAVQYDRYIELYNYPERSEFADDYFSTKYGGKVPSNSVSRFAQTIIDRNNTQGYNQRFDVAFQKDRRSTPKEKIELLRGIDAEHKKWAKDLMLYEFPELRALVNQRDAYADYRGRNPGMLFEPTADEIDAAEAQNERKLDPFGTR